MLTNGKRCKIKVQNNIVLNPKDGNRKSKKLYSLYTRKCYYRH